MKPFVVQHVIIIIIIRQPIVPWLGKVISVCRLLVSQSCGVHCLIVSLQYLSKLSLHRFDGLTCRICLAKVSSPSGDTRGPSVVFEAVDMASPGPFHLSHIADDDFCPLPDPDVGRSICVCDVEHKSFHFGLCGRKFVLYRIVWSLSRSLHNYIIAGSTQELYSSLFCTYVVANWHVNANINTTKTHNNMVAAVGSN